MKDRQIGDEVLVFDRTLYRDDLTTPLTVTLKEATIVKVYGVGTDKTADVRFHHNNRISKGHFLWGIHDKQS